MVALGEIFAIFMKLTTFDIDTVDIVDIIDKYSGMISVGSHNTLISKNLWDFKNHLGFPKNLGSKNSQVSQNFQGISSIVETINIHHTVSMVEIVVTVDAVDIAVENVTLLSPVDTENNLIESEVILQSVLPTDSNLESVGDRVFVMDLRDCT